MRDLIDDFDFGTDDEIEVAGLEDPTPDELEAFWSWVATLNHDPAIPF